jgi:hypothetical protein
MAVFFFFYLVRGGGDGEAAGLGDGGDVDVEPLAGEVGEDGLCGEGKQWIGSGSIVVSCRSNRESI